MARRWLQMKGRAEQMKTLGIRRVWRAREGRIAWPLGRTLWLAAAVIAAGTAIGAAEPAHAAAGGTTLSAGQELQAGQDLVSAGGQYTLVMQDDGNLVTYGNGCVIWASNTAGVGNSDYLAMQGDGNLVIYTSAGKPVWASNTAGTGSSNYLAMQGDGNLVVYTSSGKPVWASGAGNADQLCAPHSMGLDQYIHSSGSQYRLLMQDDGNLVLYGPSGATWASNTVGSGGTSVNMQSDGNLVIYTSAAKPVWASNTAGTGSGNHLVMQDDGNLVIYTSAGKPVWASNTAGGGSGLTTGQWAGAAGPAAAGKYYGYPYPNAPQCTAGAYRCVADKWGFYQGQCTSWVAYRLNQLNGIGFSNAYRGQHWGNAANWGTAARNLGISVNGTPAPGSVAWYSSGHVAYVEKVNSPTSVVISEMNYDYANGFRVRTITTSSGWPTGFIHVADR
jgi:surface antigen